MVRAHRMAWALLNGPIPNEMDVLHSCDNRVCVRHLFLGTHTDNMQDRDRKGRQASGDRNGARTMPERRPRGTGHGRSRLTEPLVVMIRERVARGVPQQEIADSLGLSKGTVNHVVHRRTWRHVA